jgi:hypothetical protein
MPAAGAAFLEYEGYRFTIVTVLNGLHGSEAELWYLPPAADAADSKEPRWTYYGRRTATGQAEARDQVERDFRAWVEGQLEGRERRSPWSS